MANETFGSIMRGGVNYSGGGGGDTSSLANKTDLTAIILTGTTNTSGDTITAGTWFYLNGVLVKAKADIANGATFTENTNYEAKTVGDELTELNSKSGGETYTYVGSAIVGTAQALPSGWKKAYVLVGRLSSESDWWPVTVVNTGDNIVIYSFWPAANASFPNVTSGIIITKVANGSVKIHSNGGWTTATAKVYVC